MNKDFYFFGNLFLALSVGCVFLYGMIFLHLGFQIYSLPSFVNWFLTTNAISLISVIFLIRYFRYKEFKLTFYLSILGFFASCFLILVWHTRITFHREYEAYIVPALFAFYILNTLSSASLIFPPPGRRKWLKVYGICATLFGIIILSFLTFNHYTSDKQAKVSLQRLGEWISLISGLLPIFLILNFNEEKKQLNLVDTTQLGDKLSQNVTGFVAVITLLATFFFGISLFGQALSHGRVSSQTQLLAKKFEARSFTSFKGETLSYRFQKPLNYDPQVQYPLVVELHGGAGWGTDNIRQLDGIDHIVASDETRKKYPAFIFIPQIPPGTSWGGIPGLIPKDTLVFEAIAALEREYKIDTNRRYVLGHSLGGYGSWHFVSTRPAMFAAAIPFSGEGDPTLAPNTIGVAIWAFHGALDKNVPVSGSRDMIAAIKKAGGNPRYTEFPNTGHGIWEEAENTPGLMDWLFQQKKR